MSKTKQIKKTPTQTTKRKKKNSSVMNKVQAPAVQSSQSRTGVAVQKRNKNGEMEISHAEFLGTFTPSENSFEVIKTWILNPGMIDTFPWLGGQAIFYEKYRFDSLAFKMVSAEGTSASGDVMLVPDYDSMDQAPTNESQALAFENSVQTPVWKNVSCVLKPSSLHNKGEFKFIRSGPVPGADLKTYDSGQIHLCSDATIGQRFKIWVHYRVTLKVPQVPSEVAVPSIVGLWSFPVVIPPSSTFSGWTDDLDETRAVLSTGLDPDYAGKTSTGINIVSEGFGSFLFEMIFSGTITPSGVSASPSISVTGANFELEHSYVTTGSGNWQTTSLFTLSPNAQQVPTFHIVGGVSTGSSDTLSGCLIRLVRLTDQVVPDIRVQHYRTKITDFRVSKLRGQKPKPFNCSKNGWPRGTSSTIESAEKKTMSSAQCSNPTFGDQSKSEDDSDEIPRISIKRFIEVSHHDGSVRSKKDERREESKSNRS